MALVRVHRVERRKVEIMGVTVADEEGLVRPVLAVSVAGREYQARGQRPLDRDYGIFDLPAAAIARLSRLSNLRVIPA